MKKRVLWPATVVICFAVTACGGSDDAVENDLETPVGKVGPAAGGSGAVSDTTRVPLTPLGGSAMGGEVVLMSAGASTRVNVEVTGAQGAGVHQGHVHQGTCESLGSAVAPLNPVATNDQGAGQSASTVELAMLELMNGQHVVSYHTPGGNPGPPVACASLPKADLQVGP